MLEVYSYILFAFVSKYGGWIQKGGGGRVTDPTSSGGIYYQLIHVEAMPLTAH